MKLSVIIPAYNEAKRIESCLQSLFAALQGTVRPNVTAEVIVVDNNSTDNTAELARRADAHVVFEPFNQIARARNAGADVATGDWFLFVDADTLVCSETMTDLLAAIENGRFVGGSAEIYFGPIGPAIRVLVALGNFLIRSFKLTAGCFVFCRADAFRDFGGFNEAMFAGEDAELGKSMKRWGRGKGLRIAILREHPPLTSKRKLELYRPRELAVLLFRYLLFPKRTVRNKSQLQVFYDGRR
jgi:glycosyltransferase involved in cell wall biosynthesis